MGIFFVKDKRHPIRIRHQELITNAIEWLESNYNVEYPDVNFWPVEIPGTPGDHPNGRFEAYEDGWKVVHISLPQHLKQYPYPFSYVWMINTLFHEFHHYYEKERGPSTPKSDDFPLYRLIGRPINEAQLPARLKNEEEKRVEMKAEQDFMRFQETQPTLHRWVLRGRH